MKMRGRGWSHRRGPRLRVHLIIDEAPLLEKGVHTNDGANVAHKVSPTGRGSEVLRRVEPVRVNHKVTIGHVAVL